MLEALSLPFMQHALLAALLTSIACGIIGALVVVNRMVFLAGGVAHMAYGGVGLAFFLGLPVLPCTMGFTLLASLALAGLTMYRRSRMDTVIGVFWAAGMSLGILLLDLAPGYNVDLMSYLLGSILTVPSRDVCWMAAMVLVLLLVVTFYYRDLKAMSFDPEFARTSGVPVTWLYYLLLGLLGISVVLIIQVVGLILVIALLTIPSFLAQRQARSLGRMMLLAVVWSILFCLVGLIAAYALDLTSGASIIAVGSITFFLAMVWDKCRSRSSGDQGQ
jgi:zinc transport system permease protein